MTKEATMSRQVAVLAAGLAMTESVGLAGIGAASAMSPALHVGGKYPLWTLEVKGVGCEVDFFQTEPEPEFFADNDTGDGGLWSGGGRTITTDFVEGTNGGSVFSGNFVSSTTPVEYKGRLSVSSGSFTRAKLLRGSVSTWDGFSC
jgi:hypothetical protein